MEPADPLAESPVVMDNSPLFVEGDEDEEDDPVAMLIAPLSVAVGPASPDTTCMLPEMSLAD